MSVDSLGCKLNIIVISRRVVFATLESTIFRRPGEHNFQVARPEFSGRIPNNMFIMFIILK